MISKKLLSKIVGYEVTRIDSKIDEYNMLHYETKVLCRLNIYELAHKCKEWAFKNNFYLYTWQRENNSTCSVKHIISTPPFVEEIGLYNMSTEPESIFKACEWILNEI